MTYQINSSGPSRQLLDARNVAGLALQDSFRREAGKVDPPRDFRWIKAEFTWPSFDHLTFGYGNQVFSVVVELRDGGQSLMTEHSKISMRRQRFASVTLGIRQRFSLKPRTPPTERSRRSGRSSSAWGRSWTSLAREGLRERLIRLDCGQAVLVVLHAVR